MIKRQSIVGASTIIAITRVADLQPAQGGKQRDVHKGPVEPDGSGERVLLSVYEQIVMQ